MSIFCCVKRVAIWFFLQFQAEIQNTFFGVPCRKIANDHNLSHILLRPGFVDHYGIVSIDHSITPNNHTHLQLQFPYVS